MKGKNGIDWNELGFTIYGDCPPYKNLLNTKNRANRDTTRNISNLHQYKLWTMLLQIDRGNAKLKGVKLCEEWKDFYVFETWYNDNYYEVGKEKMELSYRLFDIHNTYISPETTCFLPAKINNTIIKINNSIKRGLFVGVCQEKGGMYALYYCKNKIAFSNSKEEIIEIRKTLLRKEVYDFAEQNKDKLPKDLYDKIINKKLFKELYE